MGTIGAGGAREDRLGLVRNVAVLLFIIAVPVALFTTNVRIALNEPRVYEYAADHYDTPATTGISREETLRAGAELRAYFNRGGDEPVFIRVQRDGEPVSLFNARETEHMVDVKDLVQTTFRVQELSIVFILAYIVGVFIWAREGSLQSLARQVLLSGLVGLVTIAAIGAFAVSGFDAFWERFHVVLFTNDLWQLDPDTDRLIQMYPEAFWEDVVMWIGIATLAQLAVLAVIAGLYLGLTRRSSVSYALPDGARA
jgi:integral membrane protein (TIGR01906 family)